MRESVYQAGLIRKLKKMFPGCIVLKNDTDYLQGIQDLTILFGRTWALLEVKASESAPYQPNQEHYIDYANHMSFSKMICPENEEEVLRELEQAFAEFSGAARIS